MKQEKHEIDQLFHDGFRQEDQQVTRISRDRFEAFFTEEKTKNNSLWKRNSFRFSVAASWLLLTGFFIWTYNFQEAKPKASAHEYSDVKPTSTENLLTVSELQAEKKGNREGAIPKSNIREKSNRKAPAPKVRNRRRQLPGPMLPGLFPTTLMASTETATKVEPDVTTINTSVPAEKVSYETHHSSANSDTEANAFDIVSIDVFPGKLDFTPETKESASLKLVNDAIEESSAGFSPAEIEKVRNVEDAKSYLLRGIGRLIGVLPAATVAKSSDTEKFKKL